MQKQHAPTPRCRGKSGWTKCRAAPIMGRPEEEWRARNMQNYRPTRPQHRTKSHNQAHSEDEAHDASTDDPHPLIYRGDAELIDTQDELLQLIDRLRAVGTF